MTKEMNPYKKEAIELVDKFKDLVAVDHQYNEKPLFECQKECALISLNHTIENLKTVNFGYGLTTVHRLELVRTELKKL